MENVISSLVRNERSLRDRASGKGRFPTGRYAIALERIAPKFEVDRFKITRFMVG
jgi:hypothetical protein